MAIKGVLFDFDGTLTLPGALDFPAIKMSLGCPPDQPILEFIASEPPDRQARLMKILGEKEDASAELSLPNRGAERCLHILKAKQIPIAILTRSRLKPIAIALERFKGVAIDDFKAIITREMSLPKPHPQGVIRAAAEMGISTEELLVVGDFSFDVIAAKKAGAKAVLLTNGGGSVMAPEDPQPDYMIRHLDELPALLKEPGPEYAGGVSEAS